MSNLDLLTDKREIGGLTKITEGIDKKKTVKLVTYVTGMKISIRAST